MRHRFRARVRRTPGSFVRTVRYTCKRCGASVEAAPDRSPHDLVPDKDCAQSLARAVMES